MLLLFCRKNKLHQRTMLFIMSRQHSWHLAYSFTPSSTSRRHYLGFPPTHHTATILLLPTSPSQPLICLCPLTIIIICHDRLTPSRSCHVKSDCARTRTKHTPLAHLLITCALISVVTSFLQFIPTAYPKRGAPPKHGRAVRKYTEPSKNGRVTLNHLHMHQGSPVLPILSPRLHRHPSADQGHLHTIHPT